MKVISPGIAHWTGWMTGLTRGVPDLIDIRFIHPLIISVSWGLIATVNTGLEQEREAGAYITSIGAHQVEFTHLAISTATLRLKIFGTHIFSSLQFTWMKVGSSHW